MFGGVGAIVVGGATLMACMVRSGCVRESFRGVHCGVPLRFGVPGLSWRVPARSLSRVLVVMVVRSEARASWIAVCSSGGRHRLAAMHGTWRVMARWRRRMVGLLEGRKSGMSCGCTYRAFICRSVLVKVDSCIRSVGGGRCAWLWFCGVYTVPPLRVKWAKSSSQDAPFWFVTGAHLFCCMKHQIDVMACCSVVCGWLKSYCRGCRVRVEPCVGVSCVGFGVMVIGWLCGVEPSSWCCRGVRSLCCFRVSASAARILRILLWMFCMRLVYASWLSAYWYVSERRWGSCCV